MGRKNFGYTLVEMMVVVGIISAVATIGFYGIQGNRDATNLQNAKNDLQNILRAAHNRAVSGEGSADQTITISADGRSYIISATKYNSSSASCVSPWSSFVCGADWTCCAEAGTCCSKTTTYDTVVLPTGVTLSPAAATITFARTPNTNRFRVGSDTALNQFDITLSNSGGAKTIRINGNSSSLRIYEP